MKVLGAKQPVLRIKDGRYEIYDLHLEDFTLSTTFLNQGNSTTGHSHSWEEAYYIIEGWGSITIGQSQKQFYTGDIIVIPGGLFHRVFNNYCPKLVFLCVFKKRE